MSQEILEKAQKVDLLLAIEINKGKRNLALFIAFILLVLIASLSWSPWNFIWPTIVLLYAFLTQANLRLIQTELQRRRDESRLNSSIEFEEMESALLDIENRMPMAQSKEEKEMLAAQLNQFSETLNARASNRKNRIEAVRQEMLKEAQELHPFLNAKSFFPQFDEWVLQEKNSDLKDNFDEALIQYCDELEEYYKQYLEDAAHCTNNQCDSREPMTIEEAERILDVLGTALQQTGHRHYLLSSLQGYDARDICIALKLRTAREYLHMAQGSGSEEAFLESLKLYDSIIWHLGMFVPDEQCDDLMAESPFKLIDPITMQIIEPFASLETCTSFGVYCRSIGANDPLYWQKVYARISQEWEEGTD